MLLTEIILQVNSLASTFQFYKEVMDLPVSFSDETTLRVQAGESVLIFEKNEEINNPFYHIAFNIPSDKFEEAFKWFKTRVTFLWVAEYKSYVADFKNWNARSFYFYDTGGNILEIISRYDLDNINAKEYSGSSICSVSELRIVFPAHNFAGEVAYFMEKFSLHFFRKQSPAPNFMVTGNDEGLFIMVPEGRDWFPSTGKKSVIFPISVSFQTQYGQFNWPENN